MTNEGTPKPPTDGGGAGRSARQRRQATPPEGSSAVPAEGAVASAEVEAPRASRAPRGQGQSGAAGASPAAQARQAQGRGARGGPPAGRPKEDMTGYAPRLKDKYFKTIVPSLQKELGLANVMEVPRVTKVVLNMGMGESLANPKAMESAERDLSTITGQKPVITKAKKSIANFKIRQGMPIGMMVTLRGNRMYEFLDRLMNIALPRVRDFRGAPNNGFDGRGNYSLGLREQVIFPEIDFNSIDRIRGLQITVVTTARNDDAARKLLALMGLAFAKTGAAA